MARKRKSRRSPGDGSIWYREDTGKFQAALVVGWTPKGNARRISKSFDTRPEAAAWLTEKQRELRLGSKLDSTATVREAFDDWISAGVSLRGWEPATKDNYERVLKKHALLRLGRMRVRDVTTADVRSLLQDLAKGGASASMVKRVRGYLSMLFLDAVRMKVIVANPVAGILLAPAEEPEVQRWSEDEVAAVVRVCLDRGDQAARYVLVALGTGLRTQELLGLTWAAVDLEERMLRVEQVATVVKGKHLRPGGKTENALRDLPFDEFTASMLIAQREYVEKLRELRPELNEKLAKKGRPPVPWAGLDLVFCTSVGTVLDRTGLRRRVNAIQDAAKVTRIKLYSTRSTHGSLLADGGANLHVLAERLGHADRRYLAKKYLKGSSSTHRAVAEAIGGILGAAARCNADADDSENPVTGAPETDSRGGRRAQDARLQRSMSPN